MSRIIRTALAALAVAATIGAPAFAADPAKPADSKTEIKKSARFDTKRCAVPDALIAQDQALTHVAAKLRADQPIKIVAVGSSSTQGHGASGPSHTYPARLAVELLELWPRAQLTVVNRGVGGERTAQMVARFDRDVIAEKPDLVVWQVGTNDSLAGDAISAMRELILEGVAKLEKAGIDVVLMSPQYAPRFNERADHLLRVEAVRAAARETNVGVYRRFEIMQNWIRHDGMTMETMISKDGLHMNDLSYGCTAHLLARQIAAASHAIPLMAIKQPAPLPATVMNVPGMSAPQVNAGAMNAAPVEAPGISATAVKPVPVLPIGTPSAAGPTATSISPNTLR